MKLTGRITLRLVLLLTPLLALWAALFHYTLVDEINDEADDALEEYSELIIVRMLAGEPLPRTNEGSNNSYTILPVDEEYAAVRPWIDYYDAEVYIPEKEETEPARVRTSLFRDASGQYYELRVATPTFEKEDLLRTVLWWIVLLYVTLLVGIVGVTVWVFYRSLRPLYALLHWLDGFTPGRSCAPVPEDPHVVEFRRLSGALRQSAERSALLFEQQKQFIGNASHELQTPLAVLGGRIDWLLDQTELSEEQMGELVQMKRTLAHIVRLNKTLLLLTKIDNGQFPDLAEVDLAAMLRELKELYDEIYAARAIRCTLSVPGRFVVRLNETLASVLVSNLLRNAYLHSAEGAAVEVRAEGRTLHFENEGAEPLDADRLFDRFYRGPKRAEGSTGLGLALVRAAADRCALRVEYRFVDGRHRFTVSGL